MSQRAFPSALPVVLVLCLCACSSQLQPEVQPPPPPQPQLHASFSLAPEQTVAIAGTSLQLTFVKMIGDSRCPSGVECFWAGSADLELKVTSGTESTLITLSTHRQKEASAFGHRIQLEDVTPYPAKDQQIAPSQYKAILKVTPLPKG